MGKQLLNAIAVAEWSDCGLVKGGWLYGGLAKVELLQFAYVFPIVEFVFWWSIIVCIGFAVLWNNTYEEH